MVPVMCDRHGVWTLAAENLDRPGLGDFRWSQEIAHTLPFTRKKCGKERNQKEDTHQSGWDGAGGEGEFTVLSLFEKNVACVSLIAAQV